MNKRNASGRIEEATCEELQINLLTDLVIMLSSALYGWPCWLFLNDCLFLLRLINSFAFLYLLATLAVLHTEIIVYIRPFITISRKKSHVTPNLQSRAWQLRTWVVTWRTAPPIVSLLTSYGYFFNAFEWYSFKMITITEKCLITTIKYLIYFNEVFLRKWSQRVVRCGSKADEGHQVSLSITSFFSSRIEEHDFSQSFPWEKKIIANWSP